MSAYRADGPRSGRTLDMPGGTRLVDGSSSSDSLGESRTGQGGNNVRVVAVAGQPNTGKSTVFNRLTGLKQRVGNWPGKTVDRKEGLVETDHGMFLLVDLPGTYALTANSVEEEIAGDYLLSGIPDVVLAVVNAASLERSMYLVSELMLLDIPLVLALNMMDVAEQEGRRVDPQALEKALGVPVIPMVGTDRSQNMDDLLRAFSGLDPEQSDRRSHPAMTPEAAKLARKAEVLCLLPHAPRWAAEKMLEGDTRICAKATGALDAESLKTVRELTDGDSRVARDIFKARQDWIDAVCENAVQTIPGHASPTDRLDRLFMHPLWGRLLAFVAIPLGCVLGVVLGMLTGGMALMGAMSAGPHIKQLWPGMLGSLFAGALVPAVGWVLALMAIIGFIYAIFHFLEDTGYLARVAYLMDPLLGRLGIDGKSAIPLLMGMLCNTVAIAGSRVIDTRRRRLITITMLPFLPCSGQTGVAFMFAFALFPPATALAVIGSITLVNITLACTAGAVVNAGLPSRRSKGMVMELPLYHKPNFRTICSGVRTRVELFVRSTAGFIVAALVLVWTVSYFPHGDIHTSYLYQAGRYLEPVGAFFGLDWRFVVALISSFVAKETTAGTLAVLFAVNASDHQAIVEALRSAITPQGALAFVVASNLYLPCIATISALRSEMGSWKAMAALLGAMFTLAVAAALAAFRLGAMFF